MADNTSLNVTDFRNRPIALNWGIAPDGTLLVCLDTFEPPQRVILSAAEVVRAARFAIEEHARLAQVEHEKLQPLPQLIEVRDFTVPTITIEEDELTEPASA